MSFYAYKEIDNKINMLNGRIARAISSNDAMLKNAAKQARANALLIQPGSPEDRLVSAAASAAAEIKEYVAQIWNDGEQREVMLEHLQNELNANICFLAEERGRLEDYLAQQKNLSVQKGGLANSIELVLHELRETESKLQEVYNIYQEANKKGWKIIFYPQLAFEALKYTIEKKDEVLEEQKRRRMEDYDRLFAEQRGYLQQEAELDMKIRGSMAAIAQAETALIMQKSELGRLKEMIVKGANAYICYSMLEKKICTQKESLLLEWEFKKDMEEISVTEKELQGLLAIWEQHKNDSESVYQILQRMLES